MPRLPFEVTTVAVLVASIASTFLDVSEVMKSLFALPALGALLTFVLKQWQDYLAQRRALDLQAAEHAHSVSVASHMAKVNFDKHAAFAEEYLSAVQDATEELFRDGPRSDTSKLAEPFRITRRKYLAWLSPQIEKELIPFEMAIRRMGINEHILKVTPAGEKRTRLVDETYRIYGVVLGHEENATEEEKGMAVAAIVENIRKLLGTSQLTELRERAFHQALENADAR